MKTATPVMLSNVQPKPFKRRGQLIQPSEKNICFSVEVVRNETLRLTGWTEGTRFGYDCDRQGVPHRRELDRTFSIGESVEYDSFNFAYIGQIVAIGEKSVTIEEDDGRRHRLDIYDFCRRNFDFDLERARKRKADWLD